MEKVKIMSLVLFFVFSLYCTLLLPKVEAAVKTRATVFVSPSTIYSYSSFHISGCGYVPLQGVTVVWESPTAIAFSGGPADSNGCISLNFTSNSSGQYSLTTYQYVRNDKRAVKMSQTSFVVLPVN